MSVQSPCSVSVSAHPRRKLLPSLLLRLLPARRPASTVDGHLAAPSAGEASGSSGSSGASARVHIAAVPLSLIYHSDDPVLGSVPRDATCRAFRTDSGTSILATRTRTPAEAAADSVSNYVSKAEREARSRALRLAKQQARFYARELKRDRKMASSSRRRRRAQQQSSALRRAYADDGSDAEGSDEADDDDDDDDDERDDGDNDPKLQSLSLNLSQTRLQGDGGSPLPKSLTQRAAASSAKSNGQDIKPAPLRALSKGAKAWKSLELLPAVVPATPHPISSILLDIQHLTASSDNLPLPPPPQFLQAGELGGQALGSSPANAGASRGVLVLDGPGGGGESSVSDSTHTAEAPMPALAFFPLWESPFRVPGNRETKRAVLIKGCMNTYRKLFSYTTKMLTKIDGVLQNEQRQLEKSLAKAREAAIKKEERRLRRNYDDQTVYQDDLKRFVAELEDKDRQELRIVRQHLLGKRLDVMMARSYLMHEVQAQHLDTLRSVDLDNLHQTLAAAQEELDGTLRLVYKAQSREFAHMFKEQIRDARENGHPLSRLEKSALREGFATTHSRQRAEEHTEFHAAAQQRHEELHHLYSTIESDLNQHYNQQAAALLDYRSNLQDELLV